MTCHHFLAPEQSKKTIQTVFWASLELIENGLTRLYRFLPILGEKTRDGPTFSEANFGEGKNSRRIALNTCQLVRKRSKINTNLKK